MSPSDAMRALRRPPLSPLILGVVALTAAALAWAPEAAAQAVGDDLTREYQIMTGAWAARLFPIAQRTFLMLAGIELALSAIVWGIKRDTLDSVLGQFVLKFFLISVLYFLMVAFGTWGYTITNSLAQAGQVASGRSGLSPAAVVETGLELYGQMMSKAFAWGLLLSTADTIAATVGGFVVVLAFALIAAQLVITLVESYIVIGTGVFFFGLAAFRGTSTLTDRYLAYAFSVGIRLFLLYLLVGIGMDLATSWASTISSMSAVSFKMTFRIVMGSIIFAVVTVVIPNRTARQLTDGISFGLPSAFRAGT